MKKIKIVLISLAIIFVLLVIAGFIAFKVFLSEDKIKSYIVNYAQNTLHREVAFDKLSFNFIGFNLENFSLSEKSTFSQGTFIKADKLVIKINIFPLLYKKLQIDTLGIDGMYVQVIKDKNDKFNFDDIITANDTSKNNQTDSNYEQMLLDIDDLYITDSKILFKDEIAKLSTEISKFNMELYGFSFFKTFACETSFDINIKQDNINMVLPITLKFKTNLNNFDSNKLLINILSLETKYNNADIAIIGTVENINIPKINCNISIKNVNDQTFSDFFKPTVKYNIKSLDLKAQTTINISSHTATINNLSLVSPKSSANISGNVDWSKKDVSYNLKTDVDILLDNLAKIIPNYNLKGRLKSKATITQNFFDGSIDLNNVSSSNDSYGNISNLNAKTYIKAENKKPLFKANFKILDIDKLNIQIASLNTNYNDATLSLNAQLDKTKTSKLKLNLQSKNITNNTINNFYKSNQTFIIPALDITTQTTFDLKNKSANISNLDIKIPQSSLNTNGNIDWSNKKFIYKLDLDVDLLLDNIAKYLTDYKLKGRIKSQSKISNGNFSGNLNCADVAFVYPSFTDISNLNLKAVAKSKNNIIIESTGTFNTGNFVAIASYIGNDVNIKLKMDKLIIKENTQANTPKQKDKKAESKSDKKDFNINIIADIDIDEINVPYLLSKKTVLNTSLKSVTNNFSQINGTSNLSITNGKITNINKLSKNKFAKVFLMIFNILNNNIKNSNEVNNKEKGIVYDKMMCNLLFTNGLMKTKQVSIKMPLTTISSTGTIDFEKGNINMKVNTGLYAAMRISGTLDNPRTSFDLVGTATEILKDSTGTVENIGKKLENSFKNLFK